MRVSGQGKAAGGRFELGREAGPTQKIWGQRKECARKIRAKIRLKIQGNGLDGTPKSVANRNESICFFSLSYSDSGFGVCCEPVLDARGWKLEAGRKLGGGKGSKKGIDCEGIAILGLWRGEGRELHVLFYHGRQMTRPHGSGGKCPNWDVGRSRGVAAVLCRKLYLADPTHKPPRSQHLQLSPDV